MQQLSLFDFGEEAPKPEKKKKASKSGIEQSDSTTDKDNLSERASEDGEFSRPAIAASLPEAAHSAVPTPPSLIIEEPVVPPTASKEQHMHLEESSDNEGELDDETIAKSKPVEKGSETQLVQKNQNRQVNVPVQAPEKVSSVIEIEGATDKRGTTYPKQEATETNTEEPDSPAVSNDINEQSSKEIIFSNDQIRVKTFVAKAAVSYKKPAPPVPSEDIPVSHEHLIMETAADISSEPDTSFSPDEFESWEREQDHNEEVQYKKTEEGENEKQINSTNRLGNQTGETNSSANTPFYIEDQTVPLRKRGRKSFKEIDAEVDLINVPADEELFQKQYYPISVVAKWFRVNNSLLRFWENEFKILKPKKNKKGDRFFRPEDVKNLQLIYYLLRQKKLTINGAIKHLKSYKEQTEVNMQLIQTLNEFKGFLLELRATTEK